MAARKMERKRPVKVWLLCKPSRSLGTNQLSSWASVSLLVSRGAETDRLQWRSRAIPTPDSSPAELHEGGKDGSRGQEISPGVGSWWPEPLLQLSPQGRKEGGVQKLHPLCPHPSCSRTFREEESTESNATEKSREMEGCHLQAGALGTGWAGSSQMASLWLTTSMGWL